MKWEIFQWLEINISGHDQIREQKRVRDDLVVGSVDREGGYRAGFIGDPVHVVFFF